jgi:hypothetical protein
MPSSTDKQAKFMAAVAHGMKPKGKKGPSKKVAQEFHAADAGTKYGKGGMKGKMMKGKKK